MTRLRPRSLWWPLVGAVLVLAVGTPARGQAPAPWAGTWNTTYGAVVFTQDGASVRGTYDYFGCAATIEGTVDGAVLTGTYNECTRQGVIEFTLSADGARFTGRWRTNDSTTFQSWDGTRVGGPAVAPPPPTPPAPPAPPPAITNATITPAQAFAFPPTAGGCVSKRNFRIRLRRPSDVRYIAAKVVVNGRQVPVIVAKQRYRTIRGKILNLRRLTAQVDLRGLPKGTFRVQITAITTSLRTIRGPRPYRTCVSGRGRVGVPPL